MIKDLGTINLMTPACSNKESPLLVYMLSFSCGGVSKLLFQNFPLGLPGGNSCPDNRNWLKSGSLNSEFVALFSNNKLCMSWWLRRKLFNNRKIKNYEAFIFFSLHEIPFRSTSIWLIEICVDLSALWPPRIDFGSPMLPPAADLAIVSVLRLLILRLQGDRQAFARLC